jgi:hypothetical protein
MIKSIEEHPKYAQYKDNVFIHATAICRSCGKPITYAFINIAGIVTNRSEYNQAILNHRIGCPLGQIRLRCVFYYGAYGNTEVNHSSSRSYSNFEELFNYDNLWLSILNYLNKRI